MRRSIAALLLATLIFVPGCVPLALAGGAVAMSMISQEIDRQEAVRKAEVARQKQLLQKAEDQRRRQELQEQQRLARIAQEREEELERQRRAAADRQRRMAEERLRQKAVERQRLAQQAKEREEKLRRQRLAAAERERKAEKERRRLAKLEQSRREDTARAEIALRTVVESLRLGRWDKASFRDVLKDVDPLDKSMASEQALGQLHLAVGLYAYLVDDLALARREWRRAQELGVTKPRTVLNKMWTPGALEAFRSVN